MPRKNAGSGRNGDFIKLHKRHDKYSKNFPSFERIRSMEPGFFEKSTVISHKNAACPSFDRRAAAWYTSQERSVPL